MTGVGPERSLCVCVVGGGSSRQPELQDHILHLQTEAERATWKWGEATRCFI